MPRIFCLVGVFLCLNVSAQSKRIKRLSEILKDETIYYEQMSLTDDLSTWYPYSFKRQQELKFEKDMIYIRQIEFECELRKRVNCEKYWEDDVYVEDCDYITVTSICHRYEVILRQNYKDSVIYEEKGPRTLRDLWRELHLLENDWPKHCVTMNLNSGYTGVRYIAPGFEYDLKLKRFVSLHLGFSYGRHDHRLINDGTLNAWNISIGQRLKRDLFKKKVIGLYGGPRFSLAFTSFPEINPLTGETNPASSFEIIPAITLDLGVHYNIGRRFYAESGWIYNFWFMQNTETNRAKVLGSSFDNLTSGVYTFAFGYRFGD